MILTYTQVNGDNQRLFIHFLSSCRNMLLRLPHSTIACLLLSYLKYLMDYAHLQQQQQQQQQSLQLSHLLLR